MTELIALLDGHPSLIWVVVGAAIIAYVLKQLAEASESVSKFLGPLGSRWKSKAERVAMVEKLRSDKDQLRRTDQNAINADLLSQVEYLTERVGAMEKASRSMAKSYEVKDDYLTYDAQWHSENERHAAEQGYVFPPPKHMTFNEFRQRAEGWHE